MSPDPHTRPYRVWLYRNHRDVRLDGRHHLVWLDLYATSDREHQANQQRLQRLFVQLIQADGGSRWDEQGSQLLLTSEMDETTPATSANSFWWAPDTEGR